MLLSLIGENFHKGAPAQPVAPRAIPPAPLPGSKLAPPTAAVHAAAAAHAPPPPAPAPAAPVAAPAAGTKRKYQAADLDGKTVPELKKLCSAAGLKVGGNKTELRSRLLGEPEPPKPAKAPRVKGRKMNFDAVDAILRNSGVEDVSRVNQCLKAGIVRGFIPKIGDKSKGEKIDLDAVLCEGRCQACSNTLVCTVRDALYQPNVGWDYEEGNADGAVRCGNDDSEPNEDSDEQDESSGCGEGAYITGLCEGRPELTSGKWHNHCTECNKCQGDYRNAHCDRCGKHYFQGSGGQFDCGCRNKAKKGFGGRGRGGVDMFSLLFGGLYGGGFGGLAGGGGYSDDDEGDEDDNFF